jgi:hypothetical protein
MNTTEYATWSARRAELFAVSLDARTVSAIARDIPSLDFTRAMSALETYRDVRPYKGFWLERYQACYRTSTADMHTSETDSSLRAAAAQREEDEQATRDQREEIDAYNALPADVRARGEAFAATTSVGSMPRAVRFLTMWMHRGDDLSRWARAPKPSYCEPLKCEGDMIDQWRARLATVVAENEQLRTVISHMEVAV